MFNQLIYKRLRSLGLLLILSLGMNAQTFELKQSLDFLGIQNPVAHIVDLNNDGKLDAFIRGEDNSGQLQYLILARTIGTDSTQSEVFNVFPTTVTMGSNGVFTFSDLNNDNLMDLVISGKDTNGTIKNEIHLGSADFSFQTPLTLPSFEAENIAVADLNNDGQKEIVWQGLDNAGIVALQILSTNDGINYQAENLSLPALSQGDLVLFDFDKNNYVDLLYQGLDATGTATSLYLNNAKDFNFEQTPSGIAGLSNGNIKVADYNADGLADVLVHGVTTAGQPTSEVYLNNATNFDLAPLTLSGIGKGHAQFADLNHDGLVDISLQGAEAGGGLVNLTFLQNAGGTVDLVPNLIPNGSELSQLFGDFYFDGNLDVLQMKKVSGNWVFEFLQNTGLEKNIGPIGPAQRFAIQTFDDVKVFWSGTLDDKTPSPSISHDIYIGTASRTSNSLSPSFDLEGRRRVLVGHGNQSLNSELNIFDLAPDIYYYGIQGVDNSLHATSADTGTIDNFIEDTFVVCDDLTTENLLLCLGGDITLSNGGNLSAWYSTAQGLLGLGINLPYTPTGPDTIFYSTPGSLDCADQGAIIVGITLPAALVPLQDFIGCEVDFSGLNYQGAYDSLLWTSMNTGQTFTDNPVQTVPALMDVFFLEIYQCGLTFYDTMSIEIFPTMDITVNPDNAEIFLGGSVQLNAAGAQNYLWTPGGSLDQNDIANPIASPNQTTTYQITGTDINGCDAFGSTTVTVYDFQNLPNLNPCLGEEVSIFFPHNFDAIQWTIGTGNSTFTNPLTFTADSSTTVYLEVAIGNLIWFDTILVSPQQFEITVAADTLEIFAGDSVQLEAFGSTNYNWTPAQGLSATNISNPIAQPDQTTLYTVTGENSSMCVDSATVLVIVYNFQNIPDTTVCLDAELTLFFTGAFDELLWTIDGTNISSDENGFTFIPINEGDIFLEVIVGDLIWYDTFTVSIIDLNISVAEDTLTIFGNESVQLLATGANSYLWSPSNGLDNPTSPDPLANPSETTLYQVTGFDNFGCSDNASVLVIVNGLQDIFIPTLFTPNNDSRNELFKIYGSSLPVSLSLEVFNRSGQRVFMSDSVERISSRGWDGYYKGQAQPVGVYYWKATGTNSDGSAFSYKGKNKGSIHLLR